MVEDAARRADHHVGAVRQTQGLAAQGHAAAQGDDFDVVSGPGQAPDFLCDLVGQLTGRTQNHGLNGRAWQARALQALDQRQSKCGGFAAAGAGLGNQVLPGQRQGQTGGLDGCHLGVTQLFKVVQGGGGQRKLVKTSRCQSGMFFGHGRIIVVQAFARSSRLALSTPAARAWPSRFRPACAGEW